MSDDGRIRRVHRDDGSTAEVVVSAPIAEIHMGTKTLDALASQLQREFAPPTPEETAEVALSIAADAHSEVERLRIISSTVTTLAVALARRLVDLGEGLDSSSILIPRSAHVAATGARITMRETADGDVILLFRERAPLGLATEGMRDDG